MPTVERASLPRAVYFVWYAAVALLMTYAPYDLKARGLDDGEIGLLFGARVAASILVQLALVRAIERSGRTALSFVATAVSTVALAAALALGDGIVVAAAALILLSATQAPFLPLLDALVMTRMGERFGSVRLWGSAGYGAMVGLFALWAGTVSHATAGRVGVVAVAVIWALALPLIVRLSRTVETVRAAPEWRSPPWSRELVAFLALCALHWVPLMQFNVLFALHTEALGLSAAVPGLAVAAMIVAEVVGMRIAGRVLARIRPARLCTWIGVIGAVRWLVTGYAETAWLLIAVQLLNVASFGLWLPVALEALGRFGGPDTRGTLTARFYAVVFGIGGLLGSAAGGWLLEHGGGGAVFGMGAVCDLLAGVGLWWLLARIVQRPGAVAPAAT